MGIEPTSDSDCRSTALKPANRTSPAWAVIAFPQASGLVRCPLVATVDASVPLVMAREWHDETQGGSTGNTAITSDDEEVGVQTELDPEIGPPPRAVQPWTHVVGHEVIRRPPGRSFCSCGHWSYEG